MRASFLIALGVLLVLPVAQPRHAKSTLGDPIWGVRTAESSHALPIYFETNQGQANPQIRFISRQKGYTLFLSPGEALLASGPGHRTGLVRMTFPGANPEPEILGRGKMKGKTNYFIGDDSSSWSTSVPLYESVEYRDLYPGISLVFHGNAGKLEFDFIVSPGADPKKIELAFQGLDEMAIDPRGALWLHQGQVQIVQHKPVVFQERGSARESVSGSYVLRGEGHVGFRVGPYDHQKRLVIDPILSYSTFLGGDGVDIPWDIVVDGDGNVYITGGTSSVGFLGGDPLYPIPEGTSDAFITKLDPTGRTLLYSAILGGSDADIAQGIAVDGSGSAHVTGTTRSRDFPKFNPLPSVGGGDDAFVAKLSPDGSALLYSTTLGGSASDNGRQIALDGSGAIYVAGHTFSVDFPVTAEAYQTAIGGSRDAFVTKLEPDGSGIVYATYLGGSGEEGSERSSPPANVLIAADDAGSAYVFGDTNSPDFPTTPEGFQPEAAGGVDGFVAKLNATGSQLLYSTYLGGSDDDCAGGLALDGSGHIHVAGTTDSSDFPTVNAIQPATDVSRDAFIAKLDPSGSSLLYSTYFGGKGGDTARDIAIGPRGGVYMTGGTRSVDLPGRVPSERPPYYIFPTYNVFLAKLGSSGNDLHFSTVFGGAGADAALAIAIDGSGNAYVTGLTESLDYPVTAGALGLSKAKATDGFLAVIRPWPQVELRLREDGGQKLLTVTLRNPGPSQVRLELKAWAESIYPAVTWPIGLPTETVDLPPMSEIALLTDAPLPALLPFPGSKIAIRLLDPSTGGVIGESACTTVPCP